MTEFRKILFIDADVLVLRNIDHVMLEPDFTAAFTTECCNNGARGKLGGGMWCVRGRARGRSGAEASGRVGTPRRL